ncbi:hypothetical protein ACOME3_010133 [Neoechinorhynchus agilis]
MTENETRSEKCCKEVDPNMDQFFFSAKIDCFLNREFDHKDLLCVPGVGKRSLHKFEESGIDSIVALEEMLKNHSTTQKINLLIEKFGLKSNHARIAIFALNQRRMILSE